jgi:mRNA-degrading endonuclease RelE of RelBE toxin-antitoxin system
LKVFQTTEFLYLKKKILKKKNFYGCLDACIEDFFKEHCTFQSVYDSNYFIFSKAGLKINKIRLPNKTMNQGKSGGYRLIVACNPKTENIVLLSIYPKIGKFAKSNLEDGELLKLLKGFQDDLTYNKLEIYEL